jgi:DNA mismatch endonuclease (patch repair protein)
MTDVLTPAQRRRNMKAIHGENTGPERAVASILRERGTPYRTHLAALPGKPDIVLQQQRKVIFVHGCYWHMHSCRYGRVVARTNATFWSEKRAANAKRDRRNIRLLREDGWSVLVVWECWLRSQGRANRALARFLNERA